MQTELVMHKSISEYSRCRVQYCISFVLQFVQTELKKIILRDAESLIVKAPDTIKLHRFAAQGCGFPGD